MNFPIYIPLGGFLLHPHAVFEAVAYTVGFRSYLWLRARTGDVIADGDRWSIVAAAIVGAAIGSKVLYWFEDPFQTWQHLGDPFFLLQGKTIVGALAGGLLSVEVTKLALGIRHSTGDLFAGPIALGAAVGRIGCFLTGLGDRTYGTASTLPWAVDFGDGIFRHPTQLYEAIALALFAPVLFRMARTPHVNGDVFKVFMIGYLTFRLLVDFIKPEPSLAGLSAIQWAALAVLAAYAPTFRRWSGAARAGVETT